MIMTEILNKLDNHVTQRIKTIQEKNPMYLLKNVDISTVIKCFGEVISPSCVEEINCLISNKGKIEANHKFLEQKGRYSKFGYVFLQGLVEANQKHIARELIEGFPLDDFSDSEPKSYIQCEVLNLIQDDPPLYQSTLPVSLLSHDRAMNDEMLSDQRGKMNRYSPANTNSESMNFSTSMNDSVNQRPQISSLHSTLLTRPNLPFQCTDGASLLPSKIQQSDLALNISTADTRDNNISSTLDNGHSSSLFPNGHSEMKLNINLSNMSTTDQNNHLATRREVGTIPSQDDCGGVAFCQSNATVNINTVVENTNCCNEECSQQAEVSPNGKEGSGISNFHTAHFSNECNRVVSDIRSSELCISKSFCSSASQMPMIGSKNDTTIPKKLFDGEGDSEESPNLPVANESQDVLFSSSFDKRSCEKNNNGNNRGTVAISHPIPIQQAKNSVQSSVSSSDSNFSCNPKTAVKRDNELSQWNIDPNSPGHVSVHRVEEEQQPFESMNTHDKSLSYDTKFKEPDEKISVGDTKPDSCGNAEVHQPEKRILLRDGSLQGIPSVSQETGDQNIADVRRMHEERHVWDYAVPLLGVSVIAGGFLHKYL